MIEERGDILIKKRRTRVRSEKIKEPVVQKSSTRQKMLGVSQFFDHKPSMNS
jgi:hypothetical protein